MKILLDFFFQRNYQVYAICIYPSKNLKKFCKNIYSTKNYSSNYITNLIDKIDPKKQMKILIGSGFAENIKSPKLFLERENYGNSFETIKK